MALRSNLLVTVYTNTLYMAENGCMVFGTTFQLRTALVADFSTAKWPVYIAKDADVYKPPIPFAMLWSHITI